MSTNPLHRFSKLLRNVAVSSLLLRLSDLWDNFVVDLFSGCDTESFNYGTCEESHLVSGKKLRRPSSMALKDRSSISADDVVDC